MKVHIYSGEVLSGQMAGHAIRVDETRLPPHVEPVYTILYTELASPRRRIIGFVVGHDQLRTYFHDLRLQVRWEGDRSPLDRRSSARHPGDKAGRRPRSGSGPRVEHRRAKGGQDPIKSVVRPYPPTTSHVKRAKAR